MATKERLPRKGANGISDCQSYRVKPEIFQSPQLSILIKECGNKFPPPESALQSNAPQFLVTSYSFLVSE